MDPIDLLEQRIRAMELAVSSKGFDLPKDEVSNVTELLYQTESMITTALSCREIVTTMLKRMEVLNEYLNPTCFDNHLDIQDKRQYLLELYPEANKFLGMVAEFDQLRTFIDTTPLDNISSLAERLNTLTISNIDSKKECQEVANAIMELLQKYNNITLTLKALFAEMERTIGEIELTQQTSETGD